MGREIKRVALDFDWPMERTWVGYINPYSGEESQCEACDGSGYNAATKRIADDWYDFARTGRRWCSALTQDEVQALVDHERLHDFTHHWIQGRGWVLNDPPTVPTAEAVNAWNDGPGFGHDAINRAICVEARARRLGVYGHCDVCNGEGERWTCKIAQRLHEEWKAIEPPSGEGWQVWETVSEGSPVTPVFPTAEALIDYLVENGDAWCQKRPDEFPPSREAAEQFVRGDGWVPTMMVRAGRITTGIDIAGMD